MSGNGGHLSSLKAATSGSPPYDPGISASQNNEGNGRRSLSSREEGQNLQPGELQRYEFAANQQEQEWEVEEMQEQEEETMAVGTQRSPTTSFASGVRSVFPMGINQPRTSLRTDPKPRVTPPTATSRRARAMIPGAIQEEEEIEIIETDQRGDIAQQNDFRRASAMLQREETNILRILPAQAPPELSSIKSYTFLAELQFNKPISEKGVKMDDSKEFSVPVSLGQWVKKTREASPNFILHPYKADSEDNVITHENQIPSDDSEAISIYYHNHRVENNGILKGMVRFSVTVPWMNLKDMRSPYFKWLTHNRSYLKHTSFDADTLVLLGYLHGEHPDAARFPDLTRELKERMKLPEDLDFQLSPRNLTVVDSPIAKTKYSFRAIAVETDGKMAGALREAFFRLGDPKVAKHLWPITGKSLFIPMFKTNSWPQETLSAMAKAHSKIISQLEQIFVENIYDIDSKIVFKNTGGTETSRSLREAIQSSTNHEGEAVIHSVHQTNRPGVIRILITAANAKHAVSFFGNLHEHLRATISQEDFHKITKGCTIQLTDRTYESSDSKTYAGYAEAILRENPQDGVVVTEITSPQRKKSRMEISYSNAAKRGVESTRRRNDDESLTGTEEVGDEPVDWEQKIQASFQHLFGDQPPLRAEDVERTMQEAINKQAEESEKRLERRFANFSSELRQFTRNENEKSKKVIELMFEKQNALLFNLTQQIQSTMLKLDENIKDIAFQTNTTIVHTETPRIDVRNTSPVAQRKDIGSAGLSDAGT